MGTGAANCTALKTKDYLTHWATPSPPSRSASPSGFFYHFKDKNELAKALLVRYVEREDALFDELFARADELNEDPLHGFLVGLKMMSELMADLPNGHPGCLVASYCYQDRLFDKEVRELNASAVLNWRRRFRQRLDKSPCAIHRAWRSTSTTLPTCSPSSPMAG